MTLRTQHEKPVYVRLREIIADAILAGKDQPRGLGYAFLGEGQDPRLH